MIDKELSFSERVARMRDVAEQLETITEFVAAEAGHMAAAEKCFRSAAAIDAKSEPARARLITNLITIVP
jgi:hypothetical protein